MQEPLSADCKEPRPSGPAPHPPEPTFVLAIGGLDPSGGAGLVRDFLTAEVLEARAVLVGTAWTRQDERGVQGIEPRSAEMVQAAIEHALESFPSHRSAVKIGMVARPEIAAAIVAGLRAWRGSVVFDPVLAASGGGTLFEGSPADLLPLIRKATLLTPNLAEAAWLSSLPVETIDDSRQAARKIAQWGQTAVLVKGGHLLDQATDVLCSSAGERVFEGTRLPGRSPRGTGCALATALAVGLAHGQAIEQAIEAAKRWLAGRIQAAVPISNARFL